MVPIGASVSYIAFLAAGGGSGGMSGSASMHFRRHRSSATYAYVRTSSDASAGKVSLVEQFTEIISAFTIFAEQQHPLASAFAAASRTHSFFSARKPLMSAASASG